MAHKCSKYNQSPPLLNLMVNADKLQFILIIVRQGLSTVYVLPEAAQFNPQNLGIGPVMIYQVHQTLFFPAPTRKKEMGLGT